MGRYPSGGTAPPRAWDAEDLLESRPVGGPPDLDPRRGVDRRAVLATGAALVLAAGCGDSRPSKTSSGAEKKGAGKPQRPNRPISERPPGAKTKKRVHPPAQASALRHRGPLPPELGAYLAARHGDGSLVASRRGVLHHPVVCRGHLRAPSGGAPPVGERRLHVRYADSILYALVKDDRNSDRAIGIALVTLLAWPVSVRFADFALSSLAAAGRTSDEPTLTAALAAAGSPSPAERAREALVLVSARAGRRGR
jgi:hypothetical protein